LRPTIPTRDMATDIAALAGVLGINEYHLHTGFARLVLDEVTQLGECPAMHLGTLRLTKPCTRADVLFGALASRGMLLSLHPFDLIAIHAKNLVPTLTTQLCHLFVEHIPSNGGFDDQ